MGQNPTINKIIMGVCTFLLIFVFTFFKDSASTTSSLKTEVQVLQQQLDRLQEGTNSWLEILKVFRTELVHLQVKVAEGEGDIKLLQAKIEDVQRSIERVEKEIDALQRRHYE